MKVICTLLATDWYLWGLIRHDCYMRGYIAKGGTAIHPYVTAVDTAILMLSAKVSIAVTGY